MILIDLKEANRECLGCGICINACKTNALEMVLTSEGFRAVNCDKAKCCQCGNCSAICPQLHYEHTNSRVMKYFAARAEKKIADQCTAGGAFYILAEAFLRDNGYVCGVEMDAGRAGHIIIGSAEDLNRVLGAKYIEADPRGIFFKVKNLLDNQKKVLFCSTPCYVEALRRFLGNREYDELFTVDFVCHGVSTPLLLDKVMEGMEIEQGAPIINFFSKKWGSYLNVLEIEDGSVFRHDTDFPYFHDSCLSLRKACYNCQFAAAPHNSDITLGIWGSDKTRAIAGESSQARRDAASLILVNSVKGNELLKMSESEFEELTALSPRAAQKKRFFERYEMTPGRQRFFDYLEKGYSLSKIRAYLEREHFDVGLVANWSVYNIGAQISHYALYTVIEEMGLEVLMIEKPNTPPYPPLDKPEMFRESPYPPYALSRLYPSYESQHRLNQICDAFVVGSDQLWNLEFFWHAFDTFTLGFADAGKKKISYATSFGENEFGGTEEQRHTFQDRIKSFSSVSVREDAGKDILEKDFHVNSEVVLDPVFLANSRIYKDLIAKSHIESQTPYVFIDMRRHNTAYEDIIMDYAHQKHHEIICARNPLADPRQQSAEWKIPVTSLFAEDWLYYIRNAGFIFTDSYHAVCLAIIFKKNFLCLIHPNSKGSRRISSLLGSLGLTNLMIEDPKALTRENGSLNFEIFGAVDYSNASMKLDSLIKKSRKWLRGALLPEQRGVRQNGV